ncbi:MAG TPA: zinc-dependent metalloprotease [Flavobacteriaceae bacterium]|nr:zinc-dependent metalloprotease [Flavobacteriaceae bacterium]
MNRLYYCFAVVFFVSLTLSAQTLKPIPQQVQDFHNQHLEFQTFEVFDLKNLPETSSDLKDQAENVVSFEVNSSKLNQLLTEKPKGIEISFPYEDGEITVELYKKDIFTDAFAVYDQNEQRLDYTRGAYYRGIVKDNSNSIVAFSFFRNDIVGVVSIGGQPGNIVVGKLKNNSQYVSYADHSLTKANPFECGVEGLPEIEDFKNNSDYSTNSIDSTTDDKCVKIYYEVAYAPYVNNEKSVNQTVNWLTAVHNNINTLYENDQINISINEVLVWTEPDPFTGDHFDNLESFTVYRPFFNGDLAHLVNSPSTTSVAYLNSLCTMEYNYAYSGIDMFYQNVPTYSWTIMAMTHEMGHSFGSPHTHACYWNGNDTAIDVCAPTYDISFSEGCVDGTIPYAQGGTIMSYCHLLENVGINFNNGFGEQPANLIRNIINSRFCLSSSCTDNYEADYCFPSVVYAVEPITYVGFADIDNTSDLGSTAAYEDFTDISTEVERGETYSISLEGTTDGLYTNYFSVFIDFDEDGVFNDTDEAFFIEAGNQLSIYNSTGDDGLTATGEITIPNSTALGSKRMRIIKNYDLPKTDACEPVGFGQIEDYTVEIVESMSVENQVFEDFVYYPNPVENQLNLKASKVIEEVKVYNLLGQQVLYANPNQLETNIDMENLAPAMYMMQVRINGVDKVFKLVKP